MTFPVPAIHRRCLKLYGADAHGEAYVQFLTHFSIVDNPCSK